MSGEHRYRVEVVWTGNRGRGTADYRAYGREHRIAAPDKPEIAGSSDPDFRGDPERWNPEELLVASVSACHKLWYLHLCAEADIVVVAYLDCAEGTMAEETGGSGRFKRIVLRPEVRIEAGDVQLAADLHKRAHAMCFIANSLNFPVECEPTILQE